MAFDLFKKFGRHATQPAMPPTPEKDVLNTLAITNGTCKARLRDIIALDISNPDSPGLIVDSKANSSQMFGEESYFSLLLTTSDIDAVQNYLEGRGVNIITQPTPEPQEPALSEILVT